MRRHMEEQRLRKALRQYTVPVPRPEQKAMTKLLASKALANKPLTQGKPFLQRLKMCIRDRDAFVGLNISVL